MLVLACTGYLDYRYPVGEKRPDQWKLLTSMNGKCCATRSALNKT